MCLPVESTQSSLPPSMLADSMVEKGPVSWNALKPQFWNYFGKLTGTDGSTFTALPPAGQTKGGGKWFVPSQHVPDVLGKLARCNPPAPVTQKQGAASPMLVDFDFRWAAQVPRAWGDKLLSGAIEAYTRAASRYVVLPGQSEVFLRHRVSGYSKDGIWKDGFHLIFPDWQWPHDLKHAIRMDVLADTALQADLAALECTNPIADIVDKAVIGKNNWFPYGCDKPGVPALAPAKKWVISDGLVWPTPCTETRAELVQRLRVDVDASNAEWQPEWSLRRLQQQLDPGTPKSRTPVISRAGSSNSTQQHVWDSDWDALKTVVLSLSAKRAEAECEWKQVCWALMNLKAAAPSELEMLNLLKEFSQKASSKYNENSVQQYWYSQPSAKYSYGAGFLWAACKQDSPSTFWQLKITIDPGHQVGVAHTFKAMFPSEFCTVGDVVYHFEGHRWVQCDDTDIFLRLLTDSIRPLYLAEARRYEQKATDAQDSATSEKMELCRASHVRQAADLQKHTFRRGVVAEIKTLYRVRDFYERLDSNKDLVCFENGVYDMFSHTFRPGTPDDMCSLSVGYQFPGIRGTDGCTGMSAECTTVLQQILPHPDRLDYVLSVLAAGLSGRPIDQKCHMHVGFGSNGKSQIQSLIKLVFGQLCCEISVALFQQKRAAADNASPQQVRTKGCRIGLMGEPESQIALNMDMIKQFTGGDKITARGLYDKSPVQWSSQLSLHMFTNKSAKLSAQDGGSFRRVDVTTYESKFDPDLQQANPERHHYPADPYLERNFEQWAPQVMSELLARFPKNGRAPLLPACVTEDTRTYLGDNSQYAPFMTACLEEDATACVVMGDLKPRYKAWLQDAAEHDELEGSIPPFSLSEFRTALEGLMRTTCHGKKRFNGEERRSVFIGWKLRDWHPRPHAE